MMKLNSLGNQTNKAKISYVDIESKAFKCALNLYFGKHGMRRSPSMAKGVGLRLLSRRGSWVQIPPSALRLFARKKVSF